MKGLILFKGKYGATKQYAELLGAELQLPVMSADEITSAIISEHDYLIIGSSVYIGKLQLRDWIHRMEHLLQFKQVFFFIVCATPLDQAEKLNEISRNNIPASLRDKGHVHFLSGRMIKKKLSFMDRFMLTMGAKMQKDPSEKERMLQDFDHVKAENLAPLIRDVYSAMPHPAACTISYKPVAQLHASPHP